MQTTNVFYCRVTISPKGAIMILCRIKELKNFMAKLLTTDCFDSFLLEQALITTYNTFTISGRLQKDFYTSEEWSDTALCPYSFSRWSEIRPICFSLIRGKKTPVNMKFVLQLKPELTEKLLADSDVTVPGNFVKAFVLTIRYDETGMYCTTGVALSSFLPDKTPDRLWDKAFLRFLDRKGIAYESED